MDFHTERLYFRRYVEGDFPFLYSLLTDPETVRYIGDGKPKDRKGAKDFLDWIYRTYRAGEKLGLMVLVRKSDGERIGHAGWVPQIIEREEVIEVGYWLSPAFIGQGYASEAAAFLLQQGKKHLNDKRLVALIQPGNTASQKVAKKVGMRWNKEIMLDGRTVDLYSTE
ncbi:Protein N-acetyltransferase, RimJ/RimL family [Halobacillus karajensis]|uniref:Acetyltransferase (GNAT) family protein n=1 Tax=Halobacillus karajensis TaxID=195088 RepID=A0A024P8B0_9BACI|nr:GNAT family N-acetyltransferase [Halobacillus karajensis]CDQ20174.1 Acetyltransferase (GNAT) family protein [Halobacillus karajensis]CDQ25165.1 Acetyltransferase (GNAT) family protein [Halobacillus karajensis]CDQ28474.1 Acetyltransferase (GNAT) family protein [Halobacillus karajensis]SEI01584.1 Protein N-acetyltransferase, RimJ/RimL family [Halobacillus karajensis]